MTLTFQRAGKSPVTSQTPHELVDWRNSPKICPSIHRPLRLYPRDKPLTLFFPRRRSPDPLEPRKIVLGNSPTMEEVLAAVSADGSSIMPNLAPHLSRHLLFPLIQFEGDKAEEKDDAEQAKKILSGKIKLLEDTNMTDYVASLYCELHGVEEPPAEYTKKRQEVLAQLEKYEQATAKIADLLTQDEVVNGLRSDKVANLEFLKNQHGVSGLRAPTNLDGWDSMTDGAHTKLHRSPWRWSTPSTTLASSSSDVASTVRPPTCSTSSEFSPPITTKSRLLLGASSRPRSCRLTGNRLLTSSRT